MSEDSIIKNEEGSALKSEHHHKSGRHHHHHHRSHGAGRHHHSEHHHSEGHTYKSSSHRPSHRSSSRRNKQSFIRKIKSFFKKMSKKLTIDTDSYLDGFKKLARSQKSDSKKKYTVISRRVSFCAIILALVCYSAFTLLSGEESSHIKNANNTPSENSILKIQVMELEQKNALLQQELNRYKELYGELDEE